MRTCIIVSLVLMLAVASAQAAPYTDDFESYIGRTVHSGNQFFAPYADPNQEPNFLPNGWIDEYYQNNVQYLNYHAIVDENGPHGPASQSVSGYGNSQGLTNWDGASPPHHVVRLLPAAVNPNGTIVVEAKVNLDNPLTSFTYIVITNSQIVTGTGTDGRAGVALMPGVSDGTGAAMFDYGFGPEPRASNVPAWGTAGYVEIRLELDVDASALAEEVRSYTRAAGSTGAWTFMGSRSASGWAPTHMTIGVSQYGTLDDLILTPEPATMLVLALAGGLALLRRRR